MKSRNKEITEKELIEFAVIAANNFWRDEPDRLVFQDGKWMLYGSEFNPVKDPYHAGFLFKTIMINIDNTKPGNMIFSKSQIKHVEKGPWKSNEDRESAGLRGITILAAMIGMMIDSGDLQVKRKAVH